MTSEDRVLAAFDACFAGAGGRLPPTTGQSEFYRSRYIQYLSTFVTHPWYQTALRFTYCDLVRSSRMNAYAARFPPLDFVAITSGAVENVTGFFFLLLSHPEALPHIGDPGAEVPLYDTLATCDWVAPLQRNIGLLFDGSSPPIRPKCRTRRDAAQRFATFALDFIFFHEVAHVALGHTEFTGSQHHATTISETEVSVPTHLQQIIELNADAHSASITSGEWHRRDVDYAETPFEDASDALGQWSFAVGMLFVLFDRHRAALDAYEDEVHPHPAVRLMNVIDTSTSEAGGFSSAASEQVSALWQEAFRSIAGIVTRFHMSSAAWESLNSSNVNVRYQEHLHYWHSVAKAQLTPFRRIRSS